jgi:hypothetical protein
MLSPVFGVPPYIDSCFQPHGPAKGSLLHGYEPDAVRPIEFFHWTANEWVARIQHHLTKKFCLEMAMWVLCRKAPLEALFFDFLTKSCVATACSSLVRKGQVPCGAISVFQVFSDFGLLFLYSGHFLMVVGTWFLGLRDAFGYIPEVLMFWVG